MPAMPKMNVANLRRLQQGMTSSGERSCVRFSPSGVISKAQETNRATTNPSASNTTNAVMSDSGASTSGKSTEAISSNSQAMTVYVKATLNTLRRLSSEKNESLVLMTLQVNQVWRASSCIEDHRASRARMDRRQGLACHRHDHRTQFATIRKLCPSHLAQRKPGRFDRRILREHGQ